MTATKTQVGAKDQAGAQTFAPNGTIAATNTQDAIEEVSTDATAALAAHVADLASTANAKGASLIGIEDSGALITATTVEGALAELAASVGDVVGPASSTDNAVARFDSTTGKLLQNSAVTIDDTGVVSGATIDGTNNTLTMARIAGSTYSTIQHLQDIFHSSGSSSGGAITDGGSNTVNVAAGTGFIRATDSAVAELKYFDWGAATGLSVPSGSTRYVGIEYNGGSPQAVVRATNTYNSNSEFLLGIAVNEGGTMYIANVPHAVGDHAGQMILRTHQTMGIRRDNVTGGLALGETGTRNVTMSAGALWDRLARFAISAIDTSAGGTFDRYYSNGSGGFTKESAQTQWNNTQYDNGTGTLATMTNNRYAVQWWYVTLNGSLLCMYGTNEYTSIADAQDEQPPTSVPDRVSKLSILLGKHVFQKSAGTVIEFVSAFGATFSGSVVTDHGTLSGLGDDDHTQYLLINGTRAMTGNLLMPSTGVINWNSGDVTITHAANELTFAGASLGYVFGATTDASANVIQILSNSQEDAIYFGDAVSDTQGRIQYNHASDYMTLYTNNVERMRIDSSGLVGIGTTSPSSVLDVVGNILTSSNKTDATIKNGRFGCVHYTNAEEPFYFAYAYNDSTTNRLYLGGGTGSGNAATTIYFYTAANNTTTTGTERMRIDSSGNVGIGVTPACKFDIQATSGYGTTSQIMRIDGTSNGDDVVVFLRGKSASAVNRFAWLKMDPDANTFEINRDASNVGSHFVIDGSGNCGIGTASPSTTLHANGPIRTATYTVGTLPAAGTVGAGSRAYVTDANATTFASTVAAGGSNTVPVYSNGTNWLIG